MSGLTFSIPSGTIGAEKLTGKQGGDAPALACRAYVNFSSLSGIAIKESKNIAGITDGGVGLFTINFSDYMDIAESIVIASCGLDGKVVSVDVANNVGAVIRISVHNIGYFDAKNICVAVFG